MWITIESYPEFEEDVKQWAKYRAIGHAMISPLTVFWVLQHQRGYAPMINVFKFNISVNGSF